VQDDFKAVAKRYVGQISFAYIDGKAHAARRIALGLVDDILPGLAFNTMSGALYPFPSHQQLDQPSMKEHVDGFLTGRLQPTQASSSEQEVMAAQAEAARLGAQGLVEISRKTFNHICMDESKDVLVLFYSASAQVNKDVWPYWHKTEHIKRAPYYVQKSPIYSKKSPTYPGKNPIYTHHYVLYTQKEPCK